MNYLSDELLLDLDSFIQKFYRDPRVEGTILFQTAACCYDLELDSYLEQKRITFQDKLFEMIREKNLDEVEVYKKGNISRQLFSKIKSEKDYHPTKNTIFSLAIGMELSISETSELLEKAGYSFSSAIKSDLIIQFFMGNKNYNIFAINEALDKYGFSPL